MTHSNDSEIELQRHRLLFETMTQGVVYQAADGSIIAANPAAQHILGLTLDQLQGRTSIDPRWRAIHEDGSDFPGETHPSMLALQTGQPVLNVVMGIFNPQLEKYVWVNINAIPLFKPGQDEPFQVYGTFEDITERKQTEIALQQSETRYRTLFEQANDAFVVSTEDDEIVDVNQRACNLLGYSRAELLQMTVPDLQAPEMRGQVGRVIRQELATTQGEPFEFLDMHRDGTRIPVEITTTPSITQGDKKLVLSVVRDITERKQAEQALRRYAARLEALRKIERSILSVSLPQEIAQAALHHIQQMLPCLRASILVKNSDSADTFNILAVYTNGETRVGPGNSFPKTLFNIELLQQGKIDIINNVQPSSAPVAIQKLMKPLYAEGVRAYISVPLIAEQQLIGMLNVGAAQPHAYNSTHLEIAREITDSLAVAIHHAHLYEQARKDAETKTTLLSEVNHRVKNNLAAIVGLLYVEKKHADIQDSHRYRNIMTDLINRIEGISTVHRMLSDSEWMPLSLKKLSVKIIESASGVLPSGQSISAQVDCPSEVYIIPKQANSLAILLNELTTNTIKYALPHRKYISVYVTIARQPDGNIFLQYRDDGPGFPKAVINKQGYSVGLFLLHNIVTSDLRGKVELSNNNGAVIDIYFRPLT